MGPKVSVVIVCMNRMDILRPCLDGIKANTSVPLETFVVAYMFSEENLKTLREDYPWVKVVVSDTLRGFSENNNLALRQVTGEYTFIVNDDTYIDSPVIDRLVADFEKLPSSAAVVSPKILFPDGRVQTCGRRRFTGWGYPLRYLHFNNETKPSKWTMREGLFKTYNLNGAAFLAKTQVFREMGWFDETYFFTPEDVALGTKMNECGYGVYTDADVTLYHIANSTASRMEAAIKPARVKGALLFFSRGSSLAYFLLGSFCWCVEAARSLKYLFKDCSDPLSHNGIMSATARNTRRIIFSKLSPKEVFIKYFNQLNNK